MQLSCYKYAPAEVCAYVCVSLRNWAGLTWELKEVNLSLWRMLSVCNNTQNMQKNNKSNGRYTAFLTLFDDQSEAKCSLQTKSAETMWWMYLLYRKVIKIYIFFIKNYLIESNNVSITRERERESSLFFFLNEKLHIH